MKKITIAVLSVFLTNTVISAPAHHSAPHVSHSRVGVSHVSHISHSRGSVPRAPRAPISRSHIGTPRAPISRSHIGTPRAPISRSHIGTPRAPISHNYNHIPPSTRSNVPYNRGGNVHDRPHYTPGNIAHVGNQQHQPGADHRYGNNNYHNNTVQRQGSMNNNINSFNNNSVNINRSYNNTVNANHGCNYNRNIYSRCGNNGWGVARNGWYWGGGGYCGGYWRGRNWNYYWNGPGWYGWRYYYYNPGWLYYNQAVSQVVVQNTSVEAEVQPVNNDVIDDIYKQINELRRVRNQIENDDNYPDKQSVIENITNAIEQLKLNIK